MVKITTVRTILAVVTHLDLELEEMDVVTAFLDRDFKENIFMAIPEGPKSETISGKTGQLRKSLYGLKKSPRQWYAKMHQFLINELQFKLVPTIPVCTHGKSAQAYYKLISEV